MGNAAARGSGTASIGKTKCPVAAVMTVVEALTPHTHDYLSGPAIQETVEAAVDRPDLWEACASGMLCGTVARQDACMWEGALSWVGKGPRAFCTSP
jgi:hypothetical protein